MKIRVQDIHVCQQMAYQIHLSTTGILINPIVLMGLWVWFPKLH